MTGGLGPGRALTFAALTCATGACGGPDPVGPPDQPPIFFYWDDWEPEWAPDGSYLAIHSNRHDYDPRLAPSEYPTDDLYLLDTLGNATRLTYGSGAWGQTWSPDSQRIALSTPNHDLWVVERDGSGLTRLLEHDESVLGPAWSPAGGAIAFSGSAGRYSPNRISVFDVNDRSVTVLTDGTTSQPSWSPDGTQIVYMRYGGALPRIERMDADGSDVTVLLEAANLHDPAWSPCGDQIAFSQVAAPRTFLLRVMDVDGSNVRTLTHGEQPAWSPDCSRLAFTREFVDDYGYDGIDIWVIGADGTGERKVTQR